MMSARELLQKVLDECGADGNLYHISPNLFGEIASYLEQPEPEPIGFINPLHFENSFYSARVWKERGCNGINTPVYAEPPQRKPLSDSASDLYEALKCLVEQTVDGMGHEYDDGEWPALDKAREALAKAAAAPQAQVACNDGLCLGDNNGE